MPDSGTLSKTPYANNELKMDTGDELDELKIDTVDKLDELLCPVEKCNLAAVRRVNFIYDVNDNDSDLERRTARFLDALPHLQMLQLGGRRATGELLLQVMAFAELKTVIWGKFCSPLTELLPLWRFPVEQIEVSVEEVAGSLKRWPDPINSLKKLNLRYSTIAFGTLKKLLRLSPCLELFRYDYLMDINSE
jgi:hypothetical protein